jgi:GH24 family phage-related lysozyme (muramidase)
MSRKKKQEDELQNHPFLTERGIELIRRYTAPRTDVGMGRFASYKDYGEDIWRIGYGSKKLGKRWVSWHEKATRKQIETQLVEDLKEFSDLVAQYIFVPLNDNKKAAILSFAHSLSFSSFKECKLLDLINSLAPKKDIIREWSPYINTIWRSAGEKMIERRRVELDLYLAPDKEVPTQVQHKCATKICLLNLADTYNGSPTQIKAIEYLERKMVEWDPSGESLRRFFRYWSEKPSSLSSPPRQGSND